MEPPFNDGEKRFVLAEMIKVSHIEVGHLVSFIQQAGVNPDWLHMQLPRGRNMDQCLRAWDTMNTSQIAPPPPSSSSSLQFVPEKRKSQDDLNEQLPKRPAVWSPAATSMSVPSINTSQPTIASGPNGFTLSPSTSSPVSATAPRKRGRPSRADMEARTRQRATHVMGYAPIAPVPGPTIVPLEKPKKKGRRSAAERKLEPAVLPRRAHEISGESTTAGVQQLVQHTAQHLSQRSAAATGDEQIIPPELTPKAPVSKFLETAASIDNIKGADKKTITVISDVSE